MNKELFDSNASMYVLGYLMRSPSQLLSEKCFLSVADFNNKIHKMVFSAIENLAATPDTKIVKPQDVQMYIGQYGETYQEFTKGGGGKFVEGLFNLEANDIGQFNLHYETTKKFTILRDLEKSGIDTREFYNPSVDFLKIDAEMEKFKKLSAEQMLDAIRIKLLKIERDNVDKTGDYLQDVAKGLRELFQKFKEEPDIGPSLDGRLLNTVVSGARPGKMLFFSGPQSHGKTRSMVGMACKLSLPRIENGEILYPKDFRKSYYVATEQDIEEIQSIILAYVSGINEKKIKHYQLTEEEHEIVEKAILLIEKYKHNLILDKYSNPNVSNIRSRIVEQILQKGIECVFYDYIFIPTDSSEDRSMHQYRSDQNLMRMSNVLKEIASTYQVFMASGSQLSGTWMGPKFRDTTYLRDAKSLADKIDFGMISVKLSNEELESVSAFVNRLGCDTPNFVTDIYKNRDGDIAQCKIFSYFDFGIARRRDLFITDPYYNLIEDIKIIDYGEVKKVSLLDFITREEYTNGD